MDADPGYSERAARVLDELRSLGDEPPRVLPDRAALDGLVEAICRPDATVADLAAATGMGVEATVDLIGDLGGFVATQLGEVTPAPAAEMPEGLAAAAPRRKLGRSVAALRAPELDDAVLTRWLMRRSTQMRFPLGAETVAMVHRVAQLERLDELDQLVIPGRGGPAQSTNYGLAAMLVAAHDFMENHRAASAAAIIEVATCDPDTITVEDLDTRLAPHRWLAEAPIARLIRTAGSAPPASIPVALDEFQHALLIEGGHLARSVAELSDGQTVRLLEAAGFELDGAVINRLDREAITLVDGFGFEADRDQLQSPVHKALVAGLGDQARAALEARSRGEVDWAADYNAAVARSITLVTGS